MKKLLVLLGLALSLNFQSISQTIHCDSLDNNLRYVQIKNIEYTPLVDAVYINRLYFKITGYEPKAAECYGSATISWWLKFPDNTSRYQTALEGQYITTISTDSNSLYLSTIGLLMDVKKNATYRGFNIDISIIEN